MYAITRIASWAGLIGWGVLAAAGAYAQGTTFSQIQRGRYLSKVGDCTSCHTAKGGKEFAGGFPIDTPFGIIYSTNITPDPETGIGQWSNDDFYKAMHNGIRRDGKYLYPAFPYTSFTKLSREDVDAIKAYLDTRAPVKQENKANKLPWPLSWRAVMAGWNLLFFRPGTYDADADKSDVWNRGAYLVQGAGHCAACHTPKNMLGASKKGSHLQGGDAGGSWFAPNLSGDMRDGIGRWSTADIVEYLKTGSNFESATAGPMTDVIMNSTQYLNNDDLNAIAVYLKDLSHSKGEDAKADDKTGHAAANDQVMANGHGLYLDNCIGCHMANGAGLKGTFPPLKANASVQAERPDSLIQVVLAGEKMAAPPDKPTGLAMPAFGWKLNDQEVADLVSYIRNAWGNKAPAVAASDVGDVRKDVKKSGSSRQMQATAVH